MKRLVLAAILALALPTSVSATAFTRSGSIALDPASLLVNGGTAVIDGTASGLKGGEYIVVRLSCSQSGVVLFAQDQDGSAYVHGTPPVQWSFPLAWSNANSVDCTAQVWYATKSYGLIAPLSNPLLFTAT